MKRMFAVSLVLILMASPAFSGNWWENMKIKGDFRYRHEMIKKDSGIDARNRQRMRARLGLFFTVSDYTKAGIQLATGSNDPVSTNQTLGGGSSSKSIVLDLAYFETIHNSLPGFTLKGGKFKNPFFKPGKSELLWDSDWNPEGGALRIAKDFSQVSLTLIGAGLWIEERSSDKNSYLAAGQGVLRIKLNNKKSSIAFGTGYFYYGNAKGFSPFFDGEDAKGNSTTRFVTGGDTSVVYMNGYELAEFFAEFTQSFGKIPVTVMGDFVTNTAADSLETGWLVGIRIGKAKKPGGWAFRYNYRKVEKDAVVGIFADSDFRGGGTDAKGHEIGGSVLLAKHTYFDMTYFINTTGISQETQKDFTRLQIDLQLKF